ncbi:MAG: flippase-like domain-containing protein [Gelidibacter sp.]|nr:flippase-like domain-containing protein [Gelidibacter sp.]
MLDSLSYKTKQFFVVLIKLSIVVGAFYFIYLKLIENETLDFRVFVDFLNKKEVFSLKNILFLLFLSIFNWFFEILKWHNLVSSITKISFKTGLEQSLGALTASLFTPNRIGEYGAKAIYYPSELRKKVMLLNLVSNMMQMAVTTVFGIIGLLFFMTQYHLEIDFKKALYALTLLMLVGAFFLFSLQHKAFEIKGFSIKKIIDFIKNIRKTIIIKTVVFSVLRYFIFSFQLYYLLHIFGVSISYPNAMMVITSMYLLSSVIPSVFIFDVVIKSGVAVYLFSLIGVNELTILSIIMIMWLLNFVLPSVFGSYYVLNFNFSKEQTE